MMRFRQLFTEISQREIDKIPNDIEDLLTKKKLPFNHIFGDKLRLAEPLNSGIEHSVKSNLGHDDFHYDFDKWQVYKATDLNKKNPIRIGRAFSLKQQALLKALKNPELSEEDRKNYQSQLDSITQLLKASDLQKQYKNSQEDKYVIIYSRAPIDVLRMGDFQWSTYSCHSPSGSYYYCALADAMLNAGIIYLIRASDYQWLLHNNALQNKEIFHDDDRNVWGIKPLARMRIRMVVDENGEELAVPTLKIYSVTGHVNNDAFKKQVSAWAKRQDTNDFGWEDALTLRGGTYEDAGHTIANEVKKIWGRVISYSNDPEQEDEAAHAEELFWDEVKQLISDSESELVSWIFGNDIANKDQITINTNGYDTFEIDFDETGGYIRKIFDRFLQGDRTSLRRIEKNGVSLFCKNSFKGIILKLHNFHIHFLEGAYFYTEYDYHYDKEELFNSIEQMVRKAVNDLVGYINWPDVSDPIGLYDLKIKLYNALLKANGMPEIEIDFDDLEELNDNNYSVVLGEFDTPKNPKLDITNLVIDDVGFRNKLILLIKHWHRVLADRVSTAYKLPILGKKGLTSEFEIDFGAGYSKKRRSKKMKFYDPIASYLLGYIQFDNSKTSLKMRFDIWDSISKIIYYNYGNDGKISLKPYINLIKDREDIDFSDFKKSLQNFMDDWASKNPDQLELDLSSFKQFFKFLV